MSVGAWSSLHNLAPGQLTEHLVGLGLVLRTGPFVFRVRSRLPEVAKGLAQLYGDFPVRDAAGCDEVWDYDVEVTRVAGLRGWLRPQIVVRVDGMEPFVPMAIDHGFAMLEWGMNWCIAANAQQYLMLHAASLQKGACCVVMPGEPGAGKSTLTATLMLNGWRLLTDECTLVEPQSGALRALARPVSLKNASIGIVRAQAPGLVMSDTAHDTHKGSVAQLQTSAASVAQIDEAARATHIIFPRWAAAAPISWTPMGQAEAFEKLTENAFNYSLLARPGFDAMAALVDGCSAWSLRYSALADAISAFERLADGGAP